MNTKYEHQKNEQTVPQIIVGPFVRFWLVVRCLPFPGLSD